MWTFEISIGTCLIYLCRYIELLLRILEYKVKCWFWGDFGLGQLRSIILPFSYEADFDRPTILKVICGITAHATITGWFLPKIMGNGWAKWMGHVNGFFRGGLRIRNFNHYLDHSSLLVKMLICYWDNSSLSRMIIC